MGRMPNLTGYAWLSIGAAVATIILKSGAYIATGSGGPRAPPRRAPAPPPTPAPQAAPVFGAAALAAGLTAWPWRSAPTAELRLVMSEDPSAKILDARGASAPVGRSWTR